MSAQPQQSEQTQENTTNLAIIRVVTSPNKMSVKVRVPFPSDDSEPISLDDIKSALEQKNITFGINGDALASIVSEAKYDENVEVAFGVPPVPGRDASLEYKFEALQKLKPKEDDDGRIDYKDINFVRSAEKDQLLIIKTPVGNGEEGTNVLGESVPAPKGKDIPLPAGANTRVSEDGLSLFADIDGSIVTTGKRTSVNEVHTVGAVNTETGNIKHNGSLIIKGNVESNFEVIVKGDVEIRKNVADAKVLSGGNIMVKGGFLGSQSGLLQAVGDIHCKYVNDQIIVAGQNVNIGGEVFNSMITAGEHVNVTSSKGRIVGGRVKAKDEIKATCLGTEAGTRTELQVAYDAKLMKTYNAVNLELKQLDENLERVDEGLVVFYRMQLDGKLNPQKEAALKKLEEYKKKLPVRKEELNTKKEELESRIQQNQRARIIAIKNVYPGVVLQFGIIYKEITDVMGPSYFSLRGSTIIHEEYKPEKKD
ncbi:MAG: DUF342 domain-containing protein [candidate division Zixibacteria bacterium]|nr:DUF342 domain-containing protein [candidate division Zixibacteria bacterium]